MKHSIFVILMLCVAALPVRASEVPSTASPRLYQSLDAATNLDAAVAQASEAYNAAYGTYGADPHALAPYLASFMHALNNLHRYEEAIEIFLPVSDDLSADGMADFAILFEAGRAARGVFAFDDAEFYFLRALDIAAATHGPASYEAGLAHLELAKIVPDFTQIIRGDSLRDRVIGTGYAFHKGHEGSPQIAADIFSGDEAHPIELQIVRVVQASYLLIDGDQESADAVMQLAFDALVGMRYMDDYVLTSYIDWVASHLTQWRARRMELRLTDAYDAGELRAFGDPIPLARTFGIQNYRACIDNEPGFIVMTFSVNDLGQLPRIRPVETNLPDRLEREVWRMMRRWAYVPGQAAGERVRVNDLIFRFDLGGDERDCR